MMEEVEEIEEVVEQTAKAVATPKPPKTRKTTNQAHQPSSQRTIVILSFCVGVLLVGFVGYWFLRDGETNGPSPQEVMAEPQNGPVAESSIPPKAPPEQEPFLAAVPDTFAADPLKRSKHFTAYRDSLNRITDTLQGVFVSYACEPTCFAWFDVRRPEGKEPRPFFCPFSTVSGYPLNRFPKDGASWTLITRETAIETEAAVAKGRWAVVYELIELRRAISVVKAPEKPSTSSVYNDYEVDQAPMFRESDPYAWAYLATRNYPEPEKNLGITGMVMVSFIIGHDGKVRKVEIEERSSYLRFNDEAIRLVKAMPTWTAPGRKKGLTVNVRMLVRVDFEHK